MESAGLLTYCIIQKLLAVMKQLLNSHQRSSLEKINSEDWHHPLGHSIYPTSQPLYGAVSPVGSKHESGNLGVEVGVALLL